MADLTPPQNLDAEQSLLGAMLLDKETMARVVDVVRPEDFYDERHGFVFGAMRELYDSHRPVDLVTVTEVLANQGNLERVGGASKLAALTTGTPSAAHAAQYAEIVANKATLRRLISAASMIGELAFKETANLDETLDRAEQALFNVSRKHLKTSFIPVKEVLSGAFERIDALYENRGQLRGIPTGFKDLDDLLAGLQGANLIIVAARPSMGKTSFALNVAANAAGHGHYSVGIFSLEMSKDELVERLLASEANIDSWKMQTGNLNEQDFPAISEAMGKLAEMPIYIDDIGFINVLEIRSKARRLKAEKGLDLLIIDHMQLMEGSMRRDESRVQEMSEISRSLKALAKELNIPIIAISQLSRAVEQRERKIPQLSDLRESGSIEQDADVVMFIYREEYYNPKTERKNVADILIAKHRNGPTGRVEIYFDASRMQFRDLERRREEAPVAA
ncbi:MAG: Replicative DNA helicase [candidate division Kazan bacterium GW2011_GWA1_50_15]|uniref:Replicative DNA helicase n=2 Tax=Bacteria division Kazan-3B-28 TaxID=1798534 RepID=A0A0G1X7Q4_UNCK3|nr:MAG: Replicative DNA helicase [candidate division Kazan bacterium GW2011_GWA1_50_15]KKW25554.1 MAG: Replicative DNA helicase [candidate division Kazan bacterium GW2011_GWC1_52_13]KKW26860.1 MAG: Replicative DNA helicase [candidate division Kazan bacterium GW2011_GWB1_52_7]HAV65854.1 replicative DNA helicase [Patescibacteria group bacterium]HCR42735.1 replicative DNA helicase [Patescibacteria group bacterium]